MQNKMVRKSNSLIEASFKLSAVEQKMILFLAATIKPNDTDFQSYPIRIKDFENFLGHSSIHYERIEDLVVRLKGKNLKIVYSNEEGQEVILNVSWLSSIEHIRGSGVIDLCFDPKLKPFMLQLKNRFTKYRLENVVQLKSVFSIRIYELLKQYEKIGMRLFEISELRSMLGIDDDQYQQYSDFRKRVILPSQDELAEKTDISFDFEELKRGHSVGQIRFIIRTNRQELIQIDQAETAIVNSFTQENGELEKLIALLPSDYRSKESLRKLLQNWLEKKNFDYVARNIEYANDGSNAVKPGAGIGRGSNYRAYLSKALGGDFGLPYKEDNEAKAKAAEEAARKAREEAKAQKILEEQKEREREDNDRARVYQESLSPEALETLQAEAVLRLTAEQCDHLNKKTPGANMVLKMVMNKICLERMKISRPENP